MTASEKGHVEVVKMLLAHKATVDIPSVDGLTAQMMATIEGHVDIVKVLLTHNANVDIKNKIKASALLLASYGKFEVLWSTYFLQIKRM